MRRRGPSNCKGLSFAVEWARIRRLPNRSETPEHSRTREALGYLMLSEGEFLYRLRPKKRTRLRSEHRRQYLSLYRTVYPLSSRCPACGREKFKAVDPHTLIALCSENEPVRRRRRA